MAEKNILNYDKTKNKNKENININTFSKKFRKNNSLCNILCCKYCNDYWKPYKRKIENPVIDVNPKKIKFRKEFRCYKNCQNCKRYILKKELQWKEYMAVSGLEFDEITKQPKIKKAQIDINEDNIDISIAKIKDLKREDFQIIKTNGDGNCLTRALLKSIEEEELKHIELREIIADLIEEDNLAEFGEDLFKEEKCKNKKEYIEKVRTDGFYLGGIALGIIAKKCKLIIGIYMEDKRYEENPWIILKPEGEEYKGIILIHLKQGNIRAKNGHYSALRLFNNHYLGNLNIESFKLHKNENENDINMKDKISLNILIMNARSLKEYLKRVFIIDLLRAKDIDIGLIQETFLIKKDPLYFEGYKIYRDDHETIRRKGVAILINKKLDIDIRRLAADPNGRFVKVRIKNRIDDGTLTIATAYLEPDGDIDDINKTIFDSDVIAGDMNNANTGLNVKGVFHMKNIKIEETIEFKNNKIFDHPILIGKTKFGTYIKNDDLKISILDKEKLNNNNKVFYQIKNQEQPINKLCNTRKTIETKSFEQKVDIIRFGEEYEQIKENIRIRNKEQWEVRYRNVNTILTQNILSNENWYRINKALIKKKVRYIKVKKIKTKLSQIIKNYSDMIIIENLI